MQNNNEKKELGNLEYLMTQRFLLEDKRLDWPSIALATYFHNLYTQDKTIFTSNKFLSELARIEVRNVQVKLALLEKYGYIKRENHNEKRIILWVRKSDSKTIINNPETKNKPSKTKCTKDSEKLSTKDEVSITPPHDASITPPMSPASPIYKRI